MTQERKVQTALSWCRLIFEIRESYLGFVLQDTHADDDDDDGKEDHCGLGTTYQALRQLHCLYYFLKISISVLWGFSYSQLQVKIMRFPQNSKQYLCF